MAVRLSDLPLGVQLQVTGTDDYKRAMAEAEKATQKYEKEVADLQKRFPQAAQASKGLETQTKKAGRAAKQAARTTKEAGQAAQKSAGMFGQLKTQLIQVAAGFTAMAVGRKVIMMIGDAIEVTKQYEQSNFNLQTQMRAAEREFGLFAGQAENTKESIQELADQFRVFSDRDVATAQARLIQMTKRLGFTEEQMRVLLERTADLSAAQGIDLASGVERVAAAMRGEAESAEFLGLTLNDSWVATRAVSLGFEDNYNKLENLQKSQVRYAEFLVQTADVSGTAADSTETLAGAQGELNKEWERTQISLGEIFVPGLRDATRALADYLEIARGARVTPRVMEGISPAERGMALEDFQPGFIPGVGPTVPGAGGMFPRVPREPGAGAGFMGTGGAAAGEDQIVEEQRVSEEVLELWRDANEKWIQDRISARRNAAQQAEDIEEEYAERAAQRNEDFWRRIGDRQETQQLNLQQRRESIEMDWGQRRADLEREIGVKIAASGGEAWAEEDKNWWIQQRMIDFEREEAQAMEKLGLDEKHAGEKLALQEEQAAAQHQAEMARMETEKAEKVEAVGTEMAERLTKIDEGFQEQADKIAEKQGDMEEEVRTSYKQMTTDQTTEFVHQRRKLEAHYQIMVDFIKTHPLPNFAGAGGGGGGGDGDGNGQQFGGSGVYQSPTTLVVGEGGGASGVSRPEYVRVTPMGSGGGSQQFVRNYNQQTDIHLGTRSAQDAGAIAARVQSENARAARLAGDYGG